MFTITISTRTALLLLVAAVLALPTTAYATHLFADVSDGHPHAEGIEFMKDSGVSIGCKDGTVYCPDDPVTRAQMATFMYRLSGNDPGTPPSVNADQVDGFHAGQLVRVVFNQIANAPDQNGAIVSAPILVPREGFLIMAGSVDAGAVVDSDGLANDEYECRLRVDGNDVVGTLRRSAVHYPLLADPAGATNNSTENCGTTGVAAVTAGNHTVTLHITDRNTVVFGGASVWALYVPFSGAPPPIVLP